MFYEFQKSSTGNGVPDGHGFNDGGSDITIYTATSTPGGKVGTATKSPITVLGLINGKAYTFTVKATNDIGQGPASLASKAVTPADPLTDIGAMLGTAAAGQALTAGDLTAGGATATYQWTISDTLGGTYTDISGATTNKYTPVAGDVTGATLDGKALAQTAVTLIANNVNNPVPVNN